jgi:potassium voltage-gated channel Eag-related subfamily H protein 5
MLPSSHARNSIYFLLSFNYVKVFPKSVKLSPGPASLTRQDTIEEGGEGESNSRESSHRPSIQIDGLEKEATTAALVATASIRGRDRERDKKEREERNLSLERERQIEMAKARETTCDNYDTGLREQPSTLVQRDLISTVLDMKVDVRLEMQRMSQRIGRIEDLLTDLVNRLVIDSSEQSSPGDASGLMSSPTGTTTIQIPSSTSSGNLTPIAGLSSSTAPGGGNGLGPILLRKRRAKNRKAPAPPPAKQQQQFPAESEQSRLIESDMPSTSTRKREFL